MWWKFVLAQIGKNEVYEHPLNIPISQSLKDILEIFQDQKLSYLANNGGILKYTRMV